MNDKQLTKDAYVRDDEPIGVKEPNYSKEEIQNRNYIIKRATSSRNQREQSHVELNDMSYVDSYNSNAKVANAYLKPKRNESEVRIVSGITKEKIVTVTSAAINYNFGPNIKGFDKNDEIVAEIGNIMEDFVKKSREIENWEDKRRLIYKEAFDQGSVYVEEVWTEPIRIKKELDKVDWSDGVKVDKLKWETSLEHAPGKCEANLICGKKVYLGNMKEFYIEKQPDLFIRDQMTYAEAESIFGKWDRWKNVPRRAKRTPPLDDEEDVNNYGDRQWVLEEMDVDMVEILKYQNKWSNEYQIILNGVMMLPVGFPLTAVSPSGEYTLVKGDTDPISDDFAISTSVPNKTKVAEAVFDEYLRLSILKTQQSFRPPMANNTGRMMSDEALMPAVITSDISSEEFAPLFQPQGVTQTEFQSMEYIKGVIDNMSISSLSQGISPSGDQTKYEIQQLQAEGAKKQGLALVGLMLLEEKLIWLRIQNLLCNWTKPIDTRVDEAAGKIVDVYRTITVDTELDYGEEGKKVYEFTEDEEKLNRDQTQMDAEGDMMTKGSGETMVKRYLNPKMLRDMKLTWYVTITPTEKDSDKLDRVLFMQDITQAMQLFGPQAFNLEYLKQQWAIKAKMDPEKVLAKQDAQGMMQQEAQAGQGGEQGQSPQQAQMQAGIKPQTPSINTLSQ